MVLRGVSAAASFIGVGTGGGLVVARGALNVAASSFSGVHSGYFDSINREMCPHVTALRRLQFFFFFFCGNDKIFGRVGFLFWVLKG